MSSKASSRRPANKVTASETSVALPPRTMEEIMKEYNQLIARAGNLQYQTFVYESELSQVNQRLVDINHEAARRQELDKEAPKKEETDGSAE